MCEEENQGIPINSQFGTGSLSNCLFGDCLFSFLTSSSDKNWTTKNMTFSFAGTLVITAGSSYLLWFSEYSSQRNHQMRPPDILMISHVKIRDFPLF